MKPPDKIPARWAWHHATLLALREELIRARDAHRVDAATPVQTGGADPIDRASDLAERNVIMAELGAEEAELSAIDGALQRLHEGTYGMCVLTGRPISPARLRALPWTPYAVEAAGRKEHQTPARASGRSRK